MKRNGRPKPKGTDTVMMAFRFRCNIANFIKKKAQYERISQVDFLEALVTRAGKTFRYSAPQNNPPKLSKS